jgi:hypothetical protein
VREYGCDEAREPGGAKYRIKEDAKKMKMASLERHICARLSNFSRFDYRSLDETWRKIVRRGSKEVGKNGGPAGGGV